MWNNLLLDLQLCLPIIWWAILGVLVLSSQILFRSKSVSLALTLLGLIAGFFLETMNYLPRSAGSDPAIAFRGLVRIDEVSHILNFLGYGISLAVVLMLIPGLENTSKVFKTSYEHLPELLICLLFSGFGYSVLVSSNDMASLFIGLETFSIGLYCLCGFYRTEIRSTESAFKYLLIGAFSTVLLLYGLAFLYGATGSTDFQNIRNFLESNNNPASTTLLILSIVFLVSALGFKMAFIPFHLYSPDVYEGAPTPITAYLATAVKAGTIAAAFRIFVNVLGPVHHLWEPFWLVLCVMSVLLGNIMALQQRTIKKLLAFSSISHSGFLGLALLACQNGQNIFPLMAYTVVYSALSCGVFAVIAHLENRERFFELDDLRGLGQKRFWTSALFGLFILGLAGFPPFAGFMIKFWVLEALIRIGFVWVALAAIVGSLIGAAYYLRVLMIIFMSEDSGAASSWLPTRDRYFALRLVVLAAALITLLGGIRPQIYADWILQVLALK